MIFSSRQSYFYPRPPRGGRLKLLPLRCHEVEISTHALREEGDRSVSKTFKRTLISTHALREEGDAISPRVYLKSRLICAKWRK